MKINGANHTNFNLYKQQLQKQSAMKQKGNRSDELQISDEAMKLQEQGKTNESRNKTVQKIKQQVADGEYKIDYEKTAQKMIDFWRNV